MVRRVTGVLSTRGWIDNGRRGYRRRYYSGSSLGGLISLVIVLLISGGFLTAYGHGLKGAGIGLLCGGVVIIALTIWYYVAKSKKRRQQGEQKPIETQN